MAHAAFTRTFCHHSTKWMALSALLSWNRKVKTTNSFAALTRPFARPIFNTHEQFVFIWKWKCCRSRFLQLGQKKRTRNEQRMGPIGSENVRKCTFSYFRLAQCVSFCDAAGIARIWNFLLLIKPVQFITWFELAEGITFCSRSFCGIFQSVL